jgi:hypothetical protein
MSFFFNSLTRVGYGAIMYNGNATGIVSCHPFYTSEPFIGTLNSISGSGSATTVNINDIDDYWTVMPGYKLEVYNNSFYETLILTGDNTSGTVPVNYTISSANQASSIKLYFNGTLIQKPVTYGTLSNGITVSNYANTYNVTYNSVNYRVYEFYTDPTVNGTTCTISFTGSSTISNIQCLLIGGGGAGGTYLNTATAPGGGGAGTFLTTTFSGIPGSTFTVKVGAGGDAPAINTNNAGNAGNTTSITRTYNSVVDATLTAGGGGSGGSLSALTGNVGAIYGSTGGTGGLNSGGSTAARTASNASGTAYTVTGSVFNSISAFANTGGNSSWTGGGGGGGGAGGTGGNASNAYNGGNGGAGKVWFLNGITYAGGGGGVISVAYGAEPKTNGAPGTGGGGRYEYAATENTGSGGGGGFSTSAAGKGSNGICIIAIPI